MKPAIYPRETTAVSLTLLLLRTDPRAQHDPPDFFADRTVLEFLVVVDMPALLADRGQDSPDRPAEVGYFGPGGAPVWIPIGIATRGKFRLDPSVCEFPPLRLDFPARRIRNTVFDGQNKIKMVTHCQSAPAYQDYLLLEYLAYRTYETLSPKGFRTRLAKVTYVDATETMERVTRFAFLIEDVDDVAERNAMVEVEIDGFHGLLADAFELGVHDVFQYMIGNTDWSTFLSQNVKFMQDVDGLVSVVPFDFDWSGLVAPPYATPAPDVPTETVQDRFYMGTCRLHDHLTAVFRHFMDRRNAVSALFRHTDGLSSSERARALSYLDQFYDTIADEELATERIREACRY